MSDLELQSDVDRAPRIREARPDLDHGSAAWVDTVLRGLLRDRAKRPGAAPVMDVEELRRLRQDLNRVAGANGRVLRVAPARGPRRVAGGAAIEATPLRFVKMSAMDVAAANHYLRRTA